MKIVEFMSFSPDWFLTPPGLLITGGVLLLLIALVILLTSNKKKEEGSTEAMPAMESTVSADLQNGPTVETAPAQSIDLTPSVNNVQVETPAVNIETPNSEVAVGGVATPEPVNVAPPVQASAFGQPTPATYEIPSQPAPEINIPSPAVAEPTIPEPAITPAVPEEVKPAVSIYGGVNPVETVKNTAEPVAPVIYGGADPLENTAPIPKVESHTLYNQPEAKVVAPVQDVVTAQPTAIVNNSEPAIPDISSNPVQNVQPVAQPSAVPPVQEQQQVPIVKEDIETLDF